MQIPEFSSRESTTPLIVLGDDDTSALTSKAQRVLINEYETDRVVASLRIAGAVKTFQKNENVLALKMAKKTQRISTSRAYWMREEWRFDTSVGSDTETTIVQVFNHSDPDPFKPSGRILAAVMNELFMDYGQATEEGASFAVGSRNMKKLLKIAELYVEPSHGQVGSEASR